MRTWGAASARFATIVLTVAVIAPTGLASAANASTMSSPQKALCAKVTAWMPKHAHTGDAVDVDSGLGNCGTRHRRFRYSYVFVGPCHVNDRYQKRYILPPGYGFGESALMLVQCPGRYRLVVRAFHGNQLLDRKVRHMRVTDRISGRGGP